MGNFNKNKFYSLQWEAVKCKIPTVKLENLVKKKPCGNWFLRRQSPVEIGFSSGH